MLTRGDVENLDYVEDDQRPNDADGFAMPDDVVFNTGDWLNLLKPGRNSTIRSWRMWKRLSGMVAVISGTALVIVTFSVGSPVAENATNLETSAGSSSVAGQIGSESTERSSTVPLALDGLVGSAAFQLSSSESAFLSGLTGPAAETTTSTTIATTTTAGWAEPVIPAESNWIDAGNGVAVPEVLLRIRYCESTNNYRAAHAVSSARGAYQFLSRSWDWYGHAARYGVASADLATPAQQDEAAVLTLRRDGTRPWLASWGCWGSNDLPANYASIRPRAQPTTTSTTEGSTTSSSAGTDTTVATSTSSTSTSTTSTSTSTTDTTVSTTTTEPTTTSSTSTSTTDPSAGEGSTPTSGSTTSSAASGTD